MKRRLILAVLAANQGDVSRLAPFAKVSDDAGLEFETLHFGSLKGCLNIKGQSVTAIIFSDTNEWDLIEEIAIRFRGNLEVVVIVVTDSLKEIEALRKLPVTIVIDCETSEFAQRLNHYWLKNSKALRNALEIND